MSKSEELNKLMRSLEKIDLPLKDGHNLVFGRGSADAVVMFIGEAPGEQEDIKGEPFVGSAGKQLDKLLGSIGLSISNVYIANILKYRPPDNRDPNLMEIAAHTPFLVEQIRIIHPKIIVALGNFATKFILAGFDPERMDEIEGITKLRGKARRVKLGSEELLVLPTYHPAAMLYNPKLRTDIEEDFLLLGKMIS